MDERVNPIYLYDPSTQNNPPGVTIDYQNKGQIEVFDVGSDSDASAAVTMSSLADGSTPAGVGPVYQTLGGAIVPAAMSFLPNKSFGTFGISLAYYYNVPAGLYTLTMVDPADDCEPDLMPPLAPRGFPADAAQALHPGARHERLPERCRRLHLHAQPAHRHEAGDGG